MNATLFEDMCAVSSNVKSQYSQWFYDEKQGTTEFDFDGQPFVAEYKTNQTVGMNGNANVITKIMYPNGTEIQYEFE